MGEDSFRWHLGKLLRRGQLHRLGYETYALDDAGLPGYQMLCSGNALSFALRLKSEFP